MLILLNFYCGVILLNNIMTSVNSSLSRLPASCKSKSYDCEIKKNKNKLMYHETEINLSWHMHEYAHAPSIINVWIKYGYSRLHGNRETKLITKTWRHKSMKMRSRSGVTWLADMRTPWCGPSMMSLDCMETEKLSQKLYIVNDIARKAIPISRLYRLLSHILLK